MIFAKPQHIDIKPGDVQQVHRALASGRMVAVDRGPHDVATKLHAISDELRLHYDPHGDLWVVTQHRSNPDGSVSEHLVTTARVCDDRLVARVAQVASPGYDLAAELERSERQADAAHQARQGERIGDASERLAHALRKDFGVQRRAFIPRAFKPR
jgi:hypothetical protein